jgi:hypothetical protein
MTMHCNTTENLGQPDWAFSFHAERRRTQMGLTGEKLIRVLDDPELSYPGNTPTARVAIGAGLAVVHDPGTRTVITVLWDGAEGRGA